jgi:beta-galactosidase
VKVFSNCGEIELFLNGVSLGKRKKDIKAFPASGLQWQVSFVEGTNTLLAIGYDAGTKATSDSLTVHYTHKQNGPADDIRLSSTVLPGGNVLVTANAVDKNGQQCLDYNKRIYFSHNGAGRILTGYGTRVRSCLVEMANGKAYIELVPDPKGRAVIEARNQDLKGAFIMIPSSAGAQSSTPKRLLSNEN